MELELHGVAESAPVSNYSVPTKTMTESENASQATAFVNTFWSTVEGDGGESTMALAEVSLAALNGINNVSDVMLQLIETSFTTNNSSTSQESDQPIISDSAELYQVPIEVIIVLSLFYGSISLVAIIGNFFVIWIIGTSRRMHSITNCYIANLACADIIIGLFAIPFQFQAALLQRWNLPPFLCAFCPFVQVLSVNVSIFTLTAIAVDRYWAIVNPLKHRPSRLRVKLVLASIWVFGGATGTPYALALRVTYRVDNVTGNLKPFCQNTGIEEITWNTYNHVLVALQYFIPLVIISYAYLRMSWVLWGAKVPGNAQGPRDATVLKNKKKVIKMLLIVVLLFAFCWLPLQAYQVLQSIFPAVNRYKYINILWFCSHWLAMSNSCCNPFIYGIYNERFKREFRQRFQRCCICQQRTSNLANSELTNSNSIRMSVRFTKQTRPCVQSSSHMSQVSVL